MNGLRYELTPQMRDYDDFVDRAETRWLPYLMFFHRAGYRSSTVNTDRLGFRISTSADGPVSAADGQHRSRPVNLMVGNSTTFGVGATTDGATIPSRLAAHSPQHPWLNFGARGYGSTQEFLLFLLHRHLLPEVRNIIIFSGFNELATTGLPRSLQGEYGGFFFSGEFYGKMEEIKAEQRRRKPRRQNRIPRTEPAEEAPMSTDERIATAVDLTTRNLERWAIVSKAAGIRLFFALQALGPWTHETPTAEESALFAELDRRPSNFWPLFSGIADQQVGERYADDLARSCEKLDIAFIDMNTLLKAASPADRWLFVDRAHFNDYGYDLIAQVMANEFDLV